MVDETYHDRESSLQERVNMLNRRGYRGFSVKSCNRKWDGVEVKVVNSSGKVFTAIGETVDEAYGNVIEEIDLLLDS
ncbi:hypothetical protein [Rhodohalobacter mucosus]|uniref:Uncharacterized protein n=1 Tax=Rhodohalobacter mucosus TaxID=2079485 RepID=A0A316TZ22_9BACT|nr:hypothetical protein [Rhodohalobacter mucosus]PWN08182.1 hypothetical protein DDZ15_00680 [Rhodohalobacter mucosus]